ncbi:alpha/beta hydrolase [Pararobbsia silviterrae]|uniref:Alpha/beta hydrolase n=1 Tax=Pararobbsia silviterrae TaxID=1792498 RepID=A0A494XDJ3_9BURK|nr:alpha/beta hydrolase [Pararobbsia silviterrae]RKP46194.1 alpha/beta hydrolase [Pararobbsia silviterrae]
MSIQVVLLPGLLCDDAVWVDQREALSRIADCHVPDYGMRRSIADMVDHVLASVDASTLLVAGHSMGGRVALEIARRAPDRVAALALLDTGYEARDAGEAGAKEQAARFALLDTARAKGMRAMGEAWTPGMVHPSRLASEVYESILKMIERSTPEKFEAQIRALLDRPDATPVLAEIRCPTVLVCGTEDRWSPLSRHEEMQARMREATLHAIETCGHMSTMERPEAVTGILVEWAERAVRA